MPSTLPRPFAALAWSNLAAQSAEQLSLAAVPLVAVLALGAGPGEIGTLAAVQTLPFLLLAIPLGLLADRVSRRRLMVAAEALRALSLLAMLAMVVAGGLSIGWLAVLGFAGAVGTVGFSVAAPALVPSLVPGRLLGTANGRLELARSAAFAAGPALAGTLVAWAGASAAFVLAAVLSGAAALLLWGLAEPARAPAPPRHPLLEITEALNKSRRARSRQERDDLSANVSQPVLDAPAVELGGQRARCCPSPLGRRFSGRPAALPDQASRPGLPWVWRLASHPGKAPSRTAGFVQSFLQDGALFVWRQEFLRPMLLTGIAWNISWFVLQAVYVPYAVRALGLGAQAVGFTLAAYGAGMVVGALLAGRVTAALPFGRAVQVGPAVSVVAAATMAATLVLPSGVLAAASFFLFGVGPIVWTITTTTLRQSVTPGAMLGRASSVFLTVNAGARPVGAALGGWVGAAWGEPACLWLALAGFVVQAWVIFGSRMGTLQTLAVPAR